MTPRLTGVSLTTQNVKRTLANTMFLFLPLGDDHIRLILFKRTPAKATLSYAFELALLVDWQLGWKQNAMEVETIDSGDQAGLFGGQRRPRNVR